MPDIAYDENFESSNIQGLAWQKGVGYVQFIGGRRFGYTMDKALFTQMRDAKSIGSFFARSVKGKCPVVWTGHACDNSPCKSDATLEGDNGAGKFKVCAPCSKIPRFAAITFSPIPEGKQK